MHLARRVEVELDWPPVIGIFSAIVPAGVALEIAHERGLLSNPDTRLLWVVLACLPFILDCLEPVVPFRISPHPFLFSAVVIGSGTVLLLRPAELDFVPFLFVFLSAEMAARLHRWAGATIGAACIGVMAALEILHKFDGSFIWIVGIGFGWFAGAAIQSQFLLTRNLREAQAGLAEQAAQEERSRIAREVHDVIAHSLSVSMLHVTAARLALENNKVSDAIEALREAETQGRNSLSEVRKTVGLLGDDEDATIAPMPGVADLPRLTVDYKNAGVRIDMKIEADLLALPPAVSLNIYRIVQESLTNAVKHAPGSAINVLVRLADELLIRVHNDTGNGAAPRNDSGAGMGLQGMAERAALLGGTFETDRHDGFTVTVVAPRPEP